MEDLPIYRRFWAESPQARREKLMPFFWKTLMAEHGSIAGNPALGSSVRLTNRHRFSYPGYSEILLGEAHDDEIKSNDPIRNPHTTVLEAMRERLRWPRTGRDRCVPGLTSTRSSSTPKEPRSSMRARKPLRRRRPSNC